LIIVTFYGDGLYGVETATMDLDACAERVVHLRQDQGPPYKHGFCSQASANPGAFDTTRPGIRILPEKLK